MFQESALSLTASAKCTSEQLLQIVRRVQIVHLSHLYGAGDLMDLVYLIVRPSPAKETAEERLLQWAKHDARRVRHVAFHAAQVLAIARCWPGNLPLESFNVFHAGVALYCMCALLARTETDGIAGAQGTALRLDHLAKEETDPANEAIQAWIQDGGNVTVSVFGVSDLTGTPGPRQVLELTANMLKNMTVWGVAQYFRKVVLQLRERPEDQETPRS